MSLSDLLPFSVLAGKVPNRNGGRGIHVATVVRWSTKGVRGVRLESLMVGGTRYSSIEALERFFAATTAATAGNNPLPRTSAQRERAIAAAELELAAA